MPQDTRVAGKDGLLHVREGSAGPAGDSCSARGSPAGGRAGFARQIARTSVTEDPSASLRPSGRWCGGDRVLNLGEGGMLVESPSELKVAETVGFELWGPDFRYPGLAAVAHREHGSIGLQFVTWGRDCVNQSVRALVAARLRGQHLQAQHAGKTGADAREYRRAVVSGLPAVIDGSPAATGRRHRVLTVAEHWMLIDRLVRLGVPVRNASRAANGKALSGPSRAVARHVEHPLVPNRWRKAVLPQDPTSP